MMRRLFTHATHGFGLALGLILCTALAFGQGVPELLYYQFNGSGTTVPNRASNPPSGSGNGTIVGNLSQGGTGGLNGTGSLIGTGSTSSL
ncbi:MAG: hypothetical protein R3B47_16775 [Bacteroidia bacterium]